MRISDKPDIIEILQKEGVELRRKGRHHWALCPLPGHSEKTPSFSISPEKNSFYCFGCHSSGDSISLIMKLHNLTFKETIRYLGLSNGIRPKPDYKGQVKKVLVKDFHDWERSYFDDLCKAYRLYNLFMGSLETIEQFALCAEIYHELPLIEYRLDILQYGSDQEKYELHKEAKKYEQF